MADNDELIPVTDAIKQATGRDVDRTTGWRYGHPERSPRLETLVMGGRRLTSVNRVLAFIEACTQAREPAVTKRKGRSPAARQRDQVRAAKSLAKAGC